MAKQLPAQTPIAPVPADEDHVYASVRNTLERARSHVERAISRRWSRHIGKSADRYPKRRATEPNTVST